MEVQKLWRDAQYDAFVLVCDSTKIRPKVMVSRDLTWKTLRFSTGHELRTFVKLPTLFTLGAHATRKHAPFH